MILCLHVMNQLCGRYLAIWRFFRIKHNLLRTLIHHTKITPQGKELNTRGVTTKKNNILVLPPLYSASSRWSNQPKTGLSSLCPFGWFRYISRMGLMGWIYLDMHHATSSRPVQIFGIIPLLIFSLKSGP